MTRDCALGVNKDALALIHLVLPQTVFQDDPLVVLKLIEHLHDLCSLNDSLYVGYRKYNSGGLFESLAVTALYLAKFGPRRFGSRNTREIFEVSWTNISV